MIEKVELKEKIAAVDQNIKELWDAMDPENQKGLQKEFFILNRYISNVSNAGRDVKEHYVLTVNEFYNKHWNELQKHPKLLWMLLCMCSYDGKTTYYHEWIGNKKKTGNNNKKVNFLATLYPTMKINEVEMLSNMMTDKEIKQLAKDYGMEDKEISKILK